MLPPLVQVRTRVRFMVYGNRPAKLTETEAWILKVPPAWIAGVTPGMSSPSLTQKCGQLVADEYISARKKAFAIANASAAAGGEHDAGHYVMEGASVWLLLPDILPRRPWTSGVRRFFYVAELGGGLRKATDAEAPETRELTPFEEHAYAGWRAEEVQSWAGSSKAYRLALEQSLGANIELLGEVTAGLVRAQGKMKRFEDESRVATECLEVLKTQGVPPETALMIHVRMGENSVDSRPAEAAVAFGKALEVIPSGDSRWPELAHSRGLALLRCSDFAGALDAFERSVAAFEASPTRSQNYAQALNNFALTLERAGRLEEAEARVRRAIEMHQATGTEAMVADSRICFARVLARRGKVDEATVTLDQARQRIRPGGPNDGLAHWAQALIEHARADKAKAAQHMDRARNLLAKRAVWLSWLDEDRAGLEA